MCLRTRFLEEQLELSLLILTISSLKGDFSGDDKISMMSDMSSSTEVKVFLGDFGTVVGLGVVLVLFRSIYLKQHSSGFKILKPGTPSFRSPSMIPLMKKKDHCLLSNIKIKTQKLLQVFPENIFYIIRLLF